ncbi:MULTISPECIES: GrlR family regulatory protein [unclassified Bradyrhizobium]|uniref:GrlR family regulatory protein n=1 Tax=Bradyrhizobium sp. LLZ17 TaxID=3239388 RepID=A0AB39XMB1_9BRAD
MSTGDASERGDVQNSVRNGLYIFEIEMRDGKRGQAKGVVVLCDGRIMGGDSYFYYTGSYTFRNGKWRGDMTVNQHTEAVGKTLRLRRQRGDLRLLGPLLRRPRRG